MLIFFIHFCYLNLSFLVIDPMYYDEMIQKEERVSGKIT